MTHSSPILFPQEVPLQTEGEFLTLFISNHFMIVVEVSIFSSLTGIKKLKPSHTVKSRDVSREMPWLIWMDTQTSEQRAGVKDTQAPHSRALNFSSHLKPF